MDKLKSELEKLKQENEKLKKQAQAKVKNGDPLSNGLALKVAEKGGLSVYGLNRFPITLYKDQWKSLLEVSTEILEYLESHNDQLAEKPE